MALGCLLLAWPGWAQKPEQLELEPLVVREEAPRDVDVDALDSERYDLMTIAAVANDVAMLRLAIGAGGNPAVFALTVAIATSNSFLISLTISK